MSFARKFKRKHDESIKLRQKDIREARNYATTEEKLKRVNLGTMKKKYER